MHNQSDDFSLTKERLARDIAGEIVLSDSPEDVIKKWRDIFKISQKQLAAELDITSSVVSDYESGRRKSPGIRVIRKYVDALLDIDEKRGGQVIRSFSKSTGEGSFSDAILDIKEFDSGMSIRDFCKKINAPLIVDANSSKPIYGYTVVDSFKAITQFSAQELVGLYGKTSQRAMVFTKVETGRTPLVAIKLTNIHPALVILHGLDVVDEVAKRIAEVESIPLAICKLESEEKILDRLKSL